MPSQPIGAFFTPLQWAKWVVAENRLFERWLDGAVVFDPTAGEGSYLEAFVSIAYDGHLPITNDMLKRLFGVEKERAFTRNFFLKMKSVYGIDFPRENFRCGDYILSKNTVKADIVVGNPPWQNFNDLPPHYKEILKPYYFRYHLVSQSRELLLGGSRIDVAAVVIAKSLIESLKENGKAYFFMPLSLLLNGAAHRQFRAYRLGATEFSVERVHDFKNRSIFEGVGTRYGLVAFQRDKKQAFPIPYFEFESGEWAKHSAQPAFRRDDPLSIERDGGISLRAFESFSKIEVSAQSKPRQGVNTCGANSVFIFDSTVRLDDSIACVSNAKVKNVILPMKYLFPMLDKVNFAHPEPIPKRYVLLPYDAATGRPLDETELEKEPLLYDYLQSQQSVLQNRKGTLINAWISKGLWWALLGVGKYSFMPYKIAWEAYGKKTYRPKVFSGDWQGNQALHAYIPTEDREAALDICRKLRDPIVQFYLSSQRMEGTCNWAQPGRIARLLRVKDEDGAMGTHQSDGFAERRKAAI